MELDKKIILNYLVPKLNPVAVYLFGSFAKGMDNHESDLDIAVLTSEPVKDLSRFNMAAELSVITKKDVDLIDFNRAASVLKMEILRNKKLLYCRDSEAMFASEMTALGEYEKLNEERNPVLEKVLGKAYERYFK